MQIAAMIATQAAGCDSKQVRSQSVRHLQAWQTSPGCSSPHLMVAQGSGHGQAPGPDTEGAYRAPLHSTGAELPAKLSQTLALGLVVIQSVVATHLHNR